MSRSEKQSLLPASRSDLGGSGPHYTLVIHGGAGTMSRKNATPEQIAAYHAGLRKALEAGFAVLQAGGEAMDAAVAAVSTLEDNPLFNAGKGAVFNVAGKNELEASIMLSKPPASHPAIPVSRRGLGLTLLTRTKNPSQMVRALYLNVDTVPHVYMSGSSAESIGESMGQVLVDPSYFFTEARWKEHRRGLGHSDEPRPADASSLDMFPTGTVGAVALDVRGCICAVTSTGGRTNKLVGRVGDTPTMGSGFWAEEWKTKGFVTRAWNKLTGKPNFRAVGISGTGDGDYFIRQATASTISRRMQFLGESVLTAASIAVDDLAKDGGIGGVIALDSEGNVALPLNCEGMYRGVIREDGTPKTAIFRDDVL
ncbi:asparaginase [Dendrothele bispora CBS 962.96]|uniref:Asparaginase n=1 Tax=Dendrothele bispora (strain CBS 962.96) TaxID=1314807 RepID=A0A4S8LFE0_DENBC|nr:asparaginase [Dendrothele bispora CBS 962.96]THV06818.1 asparaginase [Dendrothele bispora CBS 962.96]